MGIYYRLVNAHGWSLKDIDETNLETLFDFIYYKDNDPNTRVINGKTYHKYSGHGAPDWL